MAIKQKLDKENEDNDYGYNFDDAYFKISNVKIDVERNQINIEIRGYASETARGIEGSIGIYKKIFKCQFNNVDFFNLDTTLSQKEAIKTACYNYIKSLPEFNEAIDI
jgi:hypothetical protein